MCCRNFFNKQRIDPAGNIGVALQKTVIVLAILDLFGIFFGFLSFVETILHSVLLFCAFYGAVKRSQRLLNVYWILQVVLMIISFIFLVVVIVFVSTHHGSSNTVNTVHPQQLHGDVHPTILTHSQNNTIFHTPTQIMRITQLAPLLMILLSIFSFLYLFVVIYLEVTSIILARRMVLLLRESPYLDEGQITRSVELQPQTPVHVF